MRETYFGYIHVPGGEQAAKFLQGQVTCDVREVTENNSLLGAHCDPKGRIQFIFRLFKRGDDFYLQMTRELIPHAINLLQKYAQFSRIKLEEGLLRGPVASAPQRVSALGAPLPRHPSVNDEFEKWKLENIQKGIPTVYPETIGLFTPHQLNLQLLNAISFNKGCYTGQEIVARMQYLGKLKQQMYRVSFIGQDVILPGTKIYNQNSQEVGELVDSAFESQKKQQALVVLNNNAVAEALYIGNSPETILTMLDLPYTHTT